MRNFQKKERWRNLIQSKSFLVFLGILTFFLIFSVFNFMGKMEEAINNRRIVEEKITELEKTKEKISSDIIQLETEEGIEENIRDKFGLAKEGEQMILIIEDKNMPETIEKVDSSFFSFLKNWFK